MQITPTRTTWDRTPCEGYAITQAVRGGLLRGGHTMGLFDNEEWRTIPDFPNYQVSDMGRLRNRRRLLGPTNSGRKCANGTWYQWTTICNKTQKKRVGVHQLVALCFIGPLPDGFQVDHKNSIRSDNRRENLRYLPSKLNAAMHDAPNGESVNHAKLSEKDVLDIRARYESGELQRTIAKDYGLHRSTVGSIVTKTTWRHI